MAVHQMVPSKTAMAEIQPAEIQPAEIQPAENHRSAVLPVRSTQTVQPTAPRMSHASVWPRPVAVKVFASRRAPVTKTARMDSSVT